MALLNKDDLVNYLIVKHQLKYSKPISPIKLQKALYFLFGLYGGKASLLNMGNVFEVDTTIPLELELFQPNFEAWVYGPVDQQVYKAFKNDEIDVTGFNLEAFEESVPDFTRGFLIDTTERIFNTSDFTLVDLSHDDNSWKNNFVRDNPRLSSPISGRDIINEYINKEFE